MSASDIGPPSASTADADPRSAARALVASEDTLRRWRSGYRWYAIVAAMVNDHRVERRREEVLERLGTWVRASAPGQAHVTLAAWGFDEPPGSVAAAVDGMTKDAVDVRLHIGGPDLFASAVYLRVDSPDASLDRVRRRFEDADRERTVPWVPHVTVGVFVEPAVLSKVRARLSTLAMLPRLEVCARVQMMAVDTRSEVGALVPARDIHSSAPGVSPEQQPLDPVSDREARSRTLRRGGFA